MPDLQLLLIQVAFIVIVTKTAGLLVRAIGQPPVIGELAAGILLGPSVFGALAPQLSSTLFPPHSLAFLQTLSQVGLLLFMFMVGLEFQPRRIRRYGHVLFLASHFSMALVFFLCSAVSLFLYPKLSDNRVTYVEFSLFLGVALGVSAFPVLARIIRERGLGKSELGALSIGCAAVDDVTAWFLLASILSLVRSMHSSAPIWWTLAGLALFVIIVLLVIRPLLALILTDKRWKGPYSEIFISLVFVLLLCCAGVTEWLGIHLVFGAFLFGVAVPRKHGISEDLEAKLRPVTEVLLLPILYAVIGLRTSFGLLQNSEMWLYCALLFAVAVAGKAGGVATAARLSGVPLRESAGFGILMNTRGLMELVIAKIGLDVGIINAAVFSMLVLVALVTTGLTSPLLMMVYPRRQFAGEAAEKQGKISTIAANA